MPDFNTFILDENHFKPECLKKGRVRYLEVMMHFGGELSRPVSWSEFNRAGQVILRKEAASAVGLSKSKILPVSYDRESTTTYDQDELPMREVLRNVRSGDIEQETVYYHERGLMVRMQIDRSMKSGNPGDVKVVNYSYDTQGRKTGVKECSWQPDQQEIEKTFVWSDDRIIRKSVKTKLDFTYEDIEMLEEDIVYHYNEHLQLIRAETTVNTGHKMLDVFKYEDDHTPLIGLHQHFFNGVQEQHSQYTYSEFGLLDQQVDLVASRCVSNAGTPPGSCHTFCLLLWTLVMLQFGLQP